MQNPEIRQQALSNLGLTSSPNPKSPQAAALTREMQRLQFQSSPSPNILSVMRGQGGSTDPSPTDPIAALDTSEIDAEIAALEQELAAMPQLTEGQPYQAPQAPPLPGAEMLQNPLLQAIQDDVTRRVFANQASRRRTGAGETAVALQNALAPTALNLGLKQQARQQTQQQQNIDNLFRLFGMGTNVATGQGQLGLTGASGIDSAIQAGGVAQGQGALGQAQAITGGLTGLFGPGGAVSQFRPPTQTYTGELYGGGGYRPTVQGGLAAGPLQSSGYF
jgi:hypothetical protein